MNDKDRLYAKPHTTVSGFAFNEPVVNVFPDMIERSVPGYTTIINMIGQIAERYAQPNSHLYDLGCSLGAATLAMKNHVGVDNTHIISIDNSPDMVKRCEEVFSNQTQLPAITFYCEDILHSDIERASVCVLNFTLQFIPVDQRNGLLEKIANGLLPGGVLVLSEKIAFDDREHHELMIELHHNFKRSQGYSDLEIAQKRTALENVLIPETLEAHRERLLTAGFRTVDCWFQCFNFISLIAFK